MAIKITVPKMHMKPLTLIDTGKLMSSFKAGIKQAFAKPRKKRKRKVLANRLKPFNRIWQAKADALGDACCHELEQLKERWRKHGSS